MFVIAGATGHVGSAVAKQLLAQKQNVKVIVRDAGKGEPFAKLGAEVAVGTVEDEAFLTGALKGATGFFAMLPPNASAEDMYGWQRKTAATIGKAVKASGVPHVVMLSSHGADIDHDNGPIKGLYHLEQALRNSGAQLTAIRAGSFMENVGSSVGAAKNMGMYFNMMPSADMPMPMIATKDIASLAVESLLHKPAKSEVVDIHGPAYTQRQVAEKLGTAVGKKLQITDVPQANWVGAMTQGGVPKQMAEAYAEMYGGLMRGLITPKGDRKVQGKTELDEVIKTIV